MKNAQGLHQILMSLDGQKYGAYKRTKGIYKFKQFQLAIDHVQVDPFAPPLKMRVIMSRQKAGIPETLLDSKLKRVAISDYLTREFHQSIQKAIHGDKNIGEIYIDHCGPEIIKRTSVVISDKHIEARIEVGLPAKGRTILGKVAAYTLSKVLPNIVEHSLRYQHLNQSRMHQQVELMVDGHSTW